MGHKIKLRYFASIREIIGHGSEDHESTASDVSGLIEELQEIGAAYQEAFADRNALRIAVDQELSDAETSIHGAKEIAFFPPMTGG